jgi:hypothetical protein
MDDVLKPRLLKGLNYFWSIRPSQWNATHVVHLHEYLKLLDLYLNGQRELTAEQMTTEEIKKVFE